MTDEPPHMPPRPPEQLHPAGPPPASSTPFPASGRGHDLRAMAEANARRYVYPLVLIALGAWFDYRLKGQIVTTLVLAAMAVAPLLFAQLVRPVAGQFFGWMRPRYRTLLAAAVPAAFLFLTRWRGRIEFGTALLVVGIPVCIGIASVGLRPRLAPLIAPVTEARDRYLPRWLRMVLAVAFPMVLAFWFVHGSLSDVGAFFGGTTSNPTRVESPVLPRRWCWPLRSRPSLPSCS